jgi:hypothetical protein
MHIKSSQQFNSMFGGATLTKTQKALSEKIRETEQKAAKKTKSKKVDRTSIVKELLCPLVPDQPADQFYQKLVRVFGRYYNGGEVIWELEAVPGSRIRLDAAFPKYKVAIEYDGWEFHGKYLKDFKKDRKKALKLTENGWVVVWVSKEMATELCDETIESIKTVISQRERTHKLDIIQLPGGWSRVVE